MSELPSAYQNLRARMREAALAETTASVLSWDQETYMPQRGVDTRSAQLEWLSGLHHRLTTSAEVGDWIKACEDAGLPADSAAGANVREWRRDYDRSTKLPQRLVEELAATTSKAIHEWSQARQASDFPRFLPHLEKLLSLTKEKADAIGWEACRYDALLDAHEPGARTAEIRALFDAFQPELSELVTEAAARSAQIPAVVLPGEFPIAAQEAFNREVAEAFGFDFTGGRVDATSHPFCTGLGPGDTRLTTRYRTEDFTDSLYSVLHECGHGLYDQGLPEEEWGAPCGQAVSLGIHESQSRLWENHVGRTREFWAHWLPRAAAHFPQLKSLTPDDMARHVLKVSPSLIRVEADEVTYDLHVILRFRIESMLFDGTLQAADVPAAWNEEFRRLLGMEVPDNRRGCLQDIHWSMGGFGYFSTYTLGNINAAQLVGQVEKDHPDLPAQLARGEYSTLLGWMREKIHRHGRRHTPRELMVAATGAPADPRHRLAYLRAKYLG